MTPSAFSTTEAEAHEPHDEEDDRDDPQEVDSEATPREKKDK